MSQDAPDNEIKPGHWYLCAKCKKCGEAIPIVEIEKDAPFAGPGGFVFRGVPCCICGEKNDYPLDDMQRLQAEPEGPLQ